jgi:putative transposase
VCLHLDQWARFRLMVIGELLAAPPDTGELQHHLERLARKQWENPITKAPLRIGFSTIERWFYLGRHHPNPIEVLRQKPRQRSGHDRLINPALEEAITRQFQEHPTWSYQLHYDNLIVRVEQNLALGPLPSYATVRRFMRQRGLHKQPRQKGRRRPNGIRLRNGGHSVKERVM